MTWNPNAAPAQAPAPNYGPPAGAPPQGAPPPGYGPPPAVYGGPQAGQSHAPAQHGQAPGGFGGGFRPVAPNLNQREPQMPFGDHIGVATGRVELVGQKRDLLIVEFEVESSNTVAPGTKGCWKRQLSGTHKANDQMVSDAIGRLVVPLSGRKSEETDPNVALNMIGEFFNFHTVDGKPIQGMRVGMTVKPNAKGKADPSGTPYADYIFHTL